MYETKKVTYEVEEEVQITTCDACGYQEVEEDFINDRPYSVVKGTGITSRKVKWFYKINKNYIICEDCSKLAMEFLKEKNKEPANILNKGFSVNSLPGSTVLGKWINGEWVADNFKDNPAITGTPHDDWWSAQ